MRKPTKQERIDALEKELAESQRETQLVRAELKGAYSSIDKIQRTESQADTRKLFMANMPLNPFTGFDDIELPAHLL